MPLTLPPAYALVHPRPGIYAAWANCLHVETGHRRCSATKTRLVAGGLPETRLLPLFRLGLQLIALLSPSYRQYHATQVLE